MYQLTHYNQQNQNFFTNCQNSWQFILIDTLPLRKVFVKSDKEASGAVDRVACVARLTHLVIADLSVSRQRYRDHCVNQLHVWKCQSFEFLFHVANVNLSGRYSAIFSETLNVDYVSAAWREFESSLGPLARDAIESVCDRLTTDKVLVEVFLCPIIKILERQTCLGY